MRLGLFSRLLFTFRLHSDSIRARSGHPSNAHTPRIQSESFVSRHLKLALPFSRQHEHWFFVWFFQCRRALREPAFHFSDDFRVFRFLLIMCASRRGKFRNQKRAADSRDFLLRSVLWKFVARLSGATGPRVPVELLLGNRSCSAK